MLKVHTESVGSFHLSQRVYWFLPYLCTDLFSILQSNRLHSKFPTWISSLSWALNWEYSENCHLFQFVMLQEQIKLFLTHCTDDDLVKLSKLIEVYTLRSEYLDDVRITMLLLVSKTCSGWNHVSCIVVQWHFLFSEAFGSSTGCHALLSLWYKFYLQTYSTFTGAAAYSQTTVSMPGMKWIVFTVNIIILTSYICWYCTHHHHIIIISTPTPPHALLHFLVIVIICIPVNLLQQYSIMCETTPANLSLQFVEEFLAAYLPCIRQETDIGNIKFVFFRYLNCQVRPDPIVLHTLGISLLEVWPAVSNSIAELQFVKSQSTHRYM